MVKELLLDALILDTHPGLNEEMLLSIAMSNSLAIVMRPDQQDYEGTSVTVSVARRLCLGSRLVVSPWRQMCASNTRTVSRPVRHSGGQFPRSPRCAG